MYERIADIMFLISMLIVVIAILKVNLLFSSVLSYDEKNIPLKVQISGLLAMAVYMASVSISFFSLAFLLDKFFDIIIPEEITKLGRGLSFLISVVVLYPQSSKLLDSITSYLKKHGLLKEDSNASHGDL